MTAPDAKSLAEEIATVVASGCANMIRLSVAGLRGDESLPAAATDMVAMVALPTADQVEALCADEACIARIEAILAPHLPTPEQARVLAAALAVSTMERQCREDHMSMDEAGALGDRLDAAKDELNAAVVALGMVGR